MYKYLPATKYQSPDKVTNRQLLVTNHQLPVTSYQSPVTSYQSPVTCYSPATIHHITASAHYRIITLAHYRISTLTHYHIKKMRLNTEIATYLKQLIQEKIPGSTVYLFGSRADDNTKGGDIDLMILTDEPADRRIFRKIRLEFVKKFGWRKIDLVNFTYSNDSSFQKLITQQCVQL